MIELANHPAYLQIEDQLDLVGQKYRVQKIVLGTVLWLTLAVVSTFLAALISHWIGATSAGNPRGSWVMGLWLTALIGGALLWIVRPLLIHPKPLDVARLIEKRVAGLHNGLTNSVLLARAEDLQSSPWLPQIFDEILNTSRSKSLDQAVALRDLRPLVVRATALVIPVIFLTILYPAPLAHGFRQMFNPSSFVPQVGTMQIVDLQPGDVTLVSGQALEVTVIATGPDTPNARLIVDRANWNTPSLTPSVQSDGKLRYTYRLEQMEESTRYRVEVGGTQSPWHSVTVVKQVKLEDLTLRITAPVYTRPKEAVQTITLKPASLDQTPMTVPQGSKVELAATVDVPVGGAMLQAGDVGAPVPMETGLGGKRFTASVTALEDTPLAILITQGAGQIIARLPEQNFIVHVTKDAAPIIDVKWPTQDAAVAPDTEIKLQATLKDDHGLAVSRVLFAAGGASGSNTGSGAPLTVVKEFPHPDQPTATELSYVVNVPSDLRKHGNAIRVQLEATDNRDLTSLSKELGPQVVVSPIYEIKFRDPQEIAAEEKEKTDKLRQRLLELLKQQQAMHTQAVAYKLGDRNAMTTLQSGQTALRANMQETADTFAFDETTKVVQKTLLVLVLNPAKDAVDLTGAILAEQAEAEQRKLNNELQSKQRRIMTTLESLLALLNASPEPVTQPTTREGGDLTNKADQLSKLNEALKEFLKEEQRILDQTAGLAKKPVDNWDDKDKKLAEELLLAQEKLDAFMQEKVNDVSKMAEQDMSNASLLKEMMEVYSEVTMAKGALKDKAMEIAVAAEEMGLEAAKEIQSNLEKWLMDKPDRQQWMQEDPLTKTDIPMAELPKELEDMIGELMENQEDLFEEMEDMDANWTDSIDKGAGWDAADGPIASMTAKGVTGNQLPNNNNMGGRSGEGRSGKSQGEFVEETASGKGGRNTPTRLDPTPFAQGQIKDESKDPVGGATGGGKISGQGGAGLEGPVPPKLEQDMQRLANKQAELRNKAERLNLQYQLGRYDNFKMLESIALMRRVESDASANRYQNALRRRDVMLDAMDTSHLLLSGRIHVQQDTTPATSHKTQQEINDAMKGQLPAAWSEALKEYYKKLGSE